jgi:hypothetical protein
VFAPASPELRIDFLDELKAIVPPPDTPWMLSGDFNMIRYCHEKNNANFRFAEAEAFNQCVNDMSLIELRCWTGISHGLTSVLFLPWKG